MVHLAPHVPQVLLHLIHLLTLQQVHRVFGHLHLQQDLLGHSQHLLNSVLRKASQWEWVREGRWQHAPVNVLIDAGILGVGRTEDQIPNRAVCNASPAGLPPMLRVFGLLGSSQVAALLLVHLGPVLLLALKATVGHHVAPSALSQESGWLVPLKKDTVFTGARCRHFGNLKTW